MTLTVTGVGVADAAWLRSAGSLTHVATLGSDDGTTASGSSYSLCSINGKRINDIVMSNPTVAEGDMDATNPITSVRFLATGRCPARGSGGSDVDFDFDTPSGYASDPETLNFFNNTNYEVEYGTTRTAKPDDSAWEYSDIENLQFNIEKNGSAMVHLAYFAAEVVYKEAAADNATFFGANF
jgi:hypothetical protein